MKRRALHQRLRATSTSCAALLLACSTIPATAQITEERTHSYRNFDMKNYAIDKVPDRAFCVMAGTIFDPAGADDNSINMLVTENFPGVIGNTITNRQFDDPNYDERAIGVHYVQGRTEDIVVVASRLDLAGGTDETNIEILRMDDQGNLSGSFIVRDRNNRIDLHALSTLLVEDDLYICGYTTDIGTPVHDYRTRKEVFVVRFNLSSNTVTNSQTFDYDYPGMEYDYDMATRMKLLDRTGYIYVTGSTSGNYVNTPPPNWDPLSAGYYCATLSLVLDRDLNTMSDVPFSEFKPIYGGWPSPDRLTAGEYGFDIVEDAGSGGYFVFGNTYVGYHPDPNPLLQFFTITYIDQQWRVPGTLRNRFRGPNFDYAWGIGVEKGNNSGWFVLNGVETDRYWQNTSGPYSWLPTSMDNINPFLTEIRPDYSTGALTVGSNYWSIILSTDGTGARFTYPNNYYDLGGFKSHIAWSPRSLTRGFDWTNDMFLSSPVWNHDGYNKLNMKTIRTNPNGRMLNDCPYDYTYTLAGVTYDTYESVDGDRTNSDFAEEVSYSEPESDFNPNYIVDCRGTGIYKPTGIGTVNAGDYRFTISPNPAHESVAVVLEGDSGQENTFEVILTDMAGRHVANLYKGGKAGLEKIALPQLAPGSYLISVSGRESGKLQSRLLIIK